MARAICEETATARGGQEAEKTQDSSSSDDPTPSPPTVPFSLNATGNTATGCPKVLLEDVAESCVGSLDNLDLNPHCPTS